MITKKLRSSFFIAFRLLILISTYISCFSMDISSDALHPNNSLLLKETEIHDLNFQFDLILQRYQSSCGDISPTIGVFLIALHLDNLKEINIRASDLIFQLYAFDNGTNIDCYNWGGDESVRLILKFFIINNYFHVLSLYIF